MTEGLVDAAQDLSVGGSWRKVFDEGGLVLGFMSLACSLMGQGGCTSDRITSFIGPEIVAEKKDPLGREEGAFSKLFKGLYGFLMHYKRF